MYRFYLTDALKAIGSLDARYYDIIQEKPVDSRSADEIKDMIKGKLREISGR